MLIHRLPTESIIVICFCCYLSIFFYYIVFLSFFPSFLFIFSLGLPSLLVPSGFWHFALSVGVCSLVDNNNNNIQLY